MRRRKTFLWLGIILVMAAAAVWGFTLWRSDQPLDPVFIAQGKSSAAAVNDMGIKMVADLSAHTAAEKRLYFSAQHLHGAGHD